MNSHEKISTEIKGHGGKRPGAGRPLGTPNRLARPLKEAAAMHSEACLNVLVDLRDHAESEQVRLAAAMAILDRAHGKPRQGLDLTKDEGITIIVDRSCGRSAVVDATPPTLPEPLSEHE
ncbi:MAG: hypothetical protein OEY86_20065 [Nitrospira sp.]|nr:hypothetical protein [Nitrospira sp.]